jgi:DNA-binding MarR family transcriptional regulator
MSGKIHDMSRIPDAPPLSDVQQEIWFAYMRVMLRLTYEMNRQLQADSRLSLADYHVLNALADSPGRRLRITLLADRIAWERSRLSHHLVRMSARGLVERRPSQSDGRGTDAVLTSSGLTALRAATPGHASSVRRMFFDGLDDELLAPLSRALDEVHEQLVGVGTLPRHVPQRRLPGLERGG